MIVYTGIERYEVLRKTYEEAVNAGVNVDYSGIEELEIEIPESFTSLPLTQYNDFKGCKIRVKNTAKQVCLFTALTEEKPISVDKWMIDGGDFCSVKELAKGNYLLVIEDENPWVDNRKGHNYSHLRQDILLLKDGKALNTVVMPYNNTESKPDCKFIKVNKKPFVIKNLSIERDSLSTAIASVFSISGYDDVRLYNVSVYTPNSTLYGENAITVTNCTNVYYDNVSFYGTYSQVDKFGYGFTLRNVWNFRASGLYGDAKWGVFGTNNVNEVYIEDSKLNRFDIHCYGRNVSFKNVTFYNLYNQFSSIYGLISFEKCSFTNFVPLLIESSYNAYVGFDVLFKDCTFNIIGKLNYLMDLGRLDSNINHRKELTQKCWPNIKIRNLNVNMFSDSREFVLASSIVVGDVVPIVDYIDYIDINGLVVNSEIYPIERVSLSNNKVETSRPIKCALKNVLINQPEHLTKSKSNKTVTLIENISIEGGSTNNINSIFLK